MFILPAVRFQAPSGGGGGGGITLVQSRHMSTNAFGTAHTFTPTSGVTAGNTVVIGFYLFNSTLPFVSPPTTNTAVALDLIASATIGSYTLYQYRLTNAGSGVTSISWTLTNSNSGEAIGIELAGVTNTTPVDATNTGSNGFQTGPHSGVGVTTTAANDAVIGLYRSDGSTLDAATQSGTAYTALPASGSSTVFMVWDVDVGAAGAQAPILHLAAGAGTDCVTSSIKKA